MNQYLNDWSNLIINCNFDNTYKMGWAKSIVEIISEINLKEIDDADVEIDADGKTVIKASEFEKYAMDYANSLLKETETISDADKGNTYQLYMEKQDVTDTSCKIVFTLTVNKDADFSIIGKDTEDEENQEEQTNQVQTPTNTSRNNIDNTTANTRLPKAGASATICVILGVAVLIAIFGLKYRNLKDVK